MACLPVSFSLGDDFYNQIKWFQNLCEWEMQQGALGEAHSGNVVFRDHPVPPKEFLIGGGDVFVTINFDLSLKFSLTILR